MGQKFKNIEAGPFFNALIKEIECKAIGNYMSIVTLSQSQNITFENNVRYTEIYTGFGQSSILNIPR